MKTFKQFIVEYTTSKSIELHLSLKLYGLRNKLKVVNDWDNIKSDKIYALKGAKAFLKHIFKGKQYYNIADVKFIEKDSSNYHHATALFEIFISADDKNWAMLNDLYEKWLDNDGHWDEKF